MAADGRLPADKVSSAGYAPGQVPTANGRGGFEPGAGGGLVIVDTTAPSSPPTGQLWYDPSATC